MWCLDATQLGRRPDGQPLLAEVLVDAASRAVIATRVGPPSDAETIVALLDHLARREGAPLVLATDNGSAYCNAAVSHWLTRAGVLHLRNLPHTPQHNGRAERAIGLLKQAAEIGPAHPPIRSCADAEDALHRGVVRLHARPREVLGGLTSPEHHRTADRWYTHAARQEVLDDVDRARAVALRDTLGPRARRRAERHAILETLVQHQLISRTRGGATPKPVKCETVS